jgi:hypothetical protein
MQMDSVIYEDSPRSDAWMRIIVFLPSSLLLIAALFIPAKDQPVATFMILFAIIVAAVTFCIIPVKYCILDSKIRIAFRGPAYFDIPFETVVTVRRSRWSTVGINLPANMSQANSVEIIRKHRLAVTITPTDQKVFIGSFEEAFNKWQKYRGQTS